jgi:ribosomal protein L11 methyltransferase
MTWTVALTCTRREAERLPDVEEMFVDPPTLNVEEPDPAQPDIWRMTGYFSEKPPAAAVTRLVNCFPSARDIVFAELSDADWTTLSQRGLEPVRAGRFLVHTAAHADAVRPGDRAIAIEAGLAFGTGQHATTLGCLRALDRLGKQRRRPQRIADIGTGTGVLAIAALKRWPAATAIASDNDPVAVAVGRGNGDDNHVRSGRAAGRLELVTAIGLHHPRLRARAPYDLILANILAPPLIAMARHMARATAPGGRVVLAGLLETQARRVAQAYRRHGLVPTTSRTRAEWPCLVFERPPKRR